MTPQRLISTDPVTIEGWSWQPFLDDAVKRLQGLDCEPYAVPNRFLQQEGQTGSKSKPIAVTTATWACKTEKFRQVRAACVSAGTAASVLNFVINPKSNYDLPFFGGDLVTLPSGHLLALDLQPAIKTDEVHTAHVWNQLIPIFERWRDQLPYGGPIPEEAQPFFSPGFLWTRLPLGEEGDDLIQSIVRPAFNEYLDLYLQLAASAERVDEERSGVLLQGQRKYTDYRAEKDPARGMLTRFYGSEWTEDYIHTVLFDL